MDPGLLEDVFLSSGFEIFCVVGNNDGFACGRIIILAMETIRTDINKTVLLEQLAHFFGRQRHTAEIPPCRLFDFIIYVFYVYVKRAKMQKSGVFLPGGIW